MDPNPGAYAELCVPTTTVLWYAALFFTSSPKDSEAQKAATREKELSDKLAVDEHLGAGYVGLDFKGSQHRSSKLQGALEGLPPRNRQRVRFRGGEHPQAAQNRRRRIALPTKVKVELTQIAKIGNIL